MKIFLLLSFILLLFGQLTPAQLAETDQASALIPYKEWQEAERKRIAFEIEEAKKIVCIVRLAEPFKPFRFKSILKVTPATLEGNETAINVAVETSSKELVFEDYGGVPTARLKYFVRITSYDGKLDGIFESKKDLQISVEELQTKGLSYSIFTHNFVLPPGEYKVGVSTQMLGISGASERNVRFTILPGNSIEFKQKL